MKINWGTGIVIGFVIFIGFILFLVITMVNSSHHDLVTKDYYQDELQYQDEIDAEENANELSIKVQSKRTSEGYLLMFPENLDANKIKGNVFLYRPSNKQLDFDLPIVLSESNLLIPDKRLLEGRWNINVKWEYEGKPYLYRDKIRY
ncbi:MAG: FixH family protein [Flavobacteriaceae bacterium]|nr:FixH family protein [Flavobacteriaceae bacterium]